MKYVKGISVACLLAGALLWLAPNYSLLRISFNAPQYPRGDPTIFLFANRVEGETNEFQVMTRFVGIRFPPKVPELETDIMIHLFRALGAATFLFGLVPFRFRRWLCVLSLLGLFGLAGWGQFRFYQSGHDLDPEAPLRMIVKPFTPPLVGYIKMGKITICHLPDTGSYLVVTAAFLVALSMFGKVGKGMVSNGDIEGKRGIGSVLSGCHE
ncbi:MAG: hypothetical protein QF752_01765 [Planctomycetota bacterium]|jgi:copper chaperone NosL|nr:hypothetical protein [Planctomycetota bacterium]